MDNDAVFALVVMVLALIFVVILLSRANGELVAENEQARQRIFELEQAERDRQEGAGCLKLLLMIVLVLAALVGALAAYPW
jgi:hypothetical protein